MTETTLKTHLPIPPRLTSAPSPHIVKALRYAKRYLWDGRTPNHVGSEFICNALPYNVGDTLAATVILPRLRAWCGDETVSTFRQALHRVTYHLPTDLSSRAVQEARHAWLDQLISEFGGE